MRLFLAAVFAAFVVSAGTALAQAPNSAALVVVVEDQSGAIVPDAAITVVNVATGAVRESASGTEGSATFGGLSLTGAYKLAVTKAGFSSGEIPEVELRAGETAVVKVNLMVSGGNSVVTVYGTAQGVRADAQIGKPITATAVDETPILGRKLTTLPLFNSSFRQGKGTGDLFVNATYFVTGGGSRRTVTYTLDGVDNNEGWGRQTMIATVPVGAVEEVSVLSNAFSAEFGWTSGPAMNIVTRSGTNAVRGEALYNTRPGRWQATSFGTDGFCPPAVSTCVTPSTLTSVAPADVPDVLNQFSGSAGGPIVKDKTFLFVASDYTRQDRTSPLSNTLPSFVLPADGSLTYTGNYRQFLFNGRLDHRMSPSQTLMVRTNVDRFYDTNPNDAVAGTSAPTVARKYSRGAFTLQANHTTVLSSTLLNEARAAFLDGDPVTKWEAQNLSTAYTRTGTVPFTIGQSRVANLYSRQFQLADTLTWSRGKQDVRLGFSVTRHISGGTGSEPGTAALGTFTFKTTTTAPFDQLTLADVQQYSQPISFGITSYTERQWLIDGYVQDKMRVTPDLTFDLGLRYDRQTLTDAKGNIEPRVGFGWHPNGNARLAVRGGYGMYYTQIRTNVVASGLTGGLDGLATYNAVPGQFGFPTCLTGSCLPLSFDPNTLPASQIPARNITILPASAPSTRHSSPGTD
ncbi:MAG: TonB-dependent receptor [Gemmatimonadaceae bacterium]